MIAAGTIAWASAAPGFRLPGPHPVLVVRSFPNGNVSVVFVTHSGDLMRVGLPLRRRDLPSAFRERGGPLTDADGVLGLIDHRGHQCILIAEPAGTDRLLVGATEIRLSHVVQLPATEWEPLRFRIRSALGLP